MVNTAYKELLELTSIHALEAHLEMKLHGYDDPTDCNPCTGKKSVCVCVCGGGGVWGDGGKGEGNMSHWLILLTRNY